MSSAIGFIKPGGADAVYRQGRMNNARPATGFITVTNLFVARFWNQLMDGIKRTREERSFA
jgi:hypothetical protein